MNKSKDFEVKIKEVLITFTKEAKSPQNEGLFVRWGPLGKLKILKIHEGKLNKEIKNIIK